MPNVMITLFLLTVYGVMVGGLAQMREIVKEQDVYKRERLVNLRIFPYVMSKIWVAAILAVYASLVYMVVHYLAFDMPGGSTEFVLMFISLTLATMAGMMLGLFASALAPNANSAPLIVVLLDAAANCFGRRPCASSGNDHRANFDALGFSSFYGHYRGWFRCRRRCLLDPTG